MSCYGGWAKLRAWSGMQFRWLGGCWRRCGRACSGVVAGHQLPAGGGYRGGVASCSRSVAGTVRTAMASVGARRRGMDAAYRHPGGHGMCKGRGPPFGTMGPSWLGCLSRRRPRATISRVTPRRGDRFRPHLRPHRTLGWHRAAGVHRADGSGSVRRSGPVEPGALGSDRSADLCGDPA